jgi:aminoglycoside phosphotransferase (APT) family kinase protein
MTREQERLRKWSWKAQQERLLTDPDFIVQRVAPLLPELNCRSGQSDWVAELVRFKAGDRMTVFYTFGHSACVYAKTYFDSEIARATHAALAHLWKQGFGANSCLGIPEPLGFVEDANFVVLRRVEGVPLNELAAAAPIPTALAAARKAAQWLVKFHSTEIPGLELEPTVERIEILNLAHALAKTAAECPGYPSLLIGMLHHLESLAPKNILSSPLAPLHDQFRPAHVLIDRERATVIDIEKLCLSDPAKDVARFVYAVKKNCMENGCTRERSDIIAREFIREYASVAPSNLENLPYFRALFAFRALSKILKSHRVTEEARQYASEMYRLEFEEATGRCAPPVAA